MIIEGMYACRRKMEKRARAAISVSPFQIDRAKIIFEKTSIPKKKTKTYGNGCIFPTKSMRVGRLQNFEKDKTGCFEGRRDELDL